LLLRNFLAPASAPLNSADDDTDKYQTNFNNRYTPSRKFGIYGTFDTKYY